jgi:hypothetical protein
MRNRPSRASRAIPTLLALIGVIGCGGTADAYVLPPEQILKFMTANFSAIQSLEIVHTVEVGTGESPRSMFQERLWLKAPGSFAAERSPLEKPLRFSEGDSPRETDAEAPRLQPELPTATGGRLPMVFRRFLMANRVDSLMDLLRRLGIHTASSGWARIQGKVAYRIGGSSPEGSRLLVEKDTFLPLLLQHGVPQGPGAEQIRVRFREYRKCGKGWYPYEIICSSTSGSAEIYRIQRIQVNVPPPVPLRAITIHPQPSGAQIQGKTPEYLRPDSGSSVSGSKDEPKP